MESEEKETFQRRKRRSIRLRRRSAVPLVPFDIGLDAAVDEEVPLPVEPVVVPTQDDVYGSLWMDTKEPVARKKRRRSSMLLGSSQQPRLLHSQLNEDISDDLNTGHEEISTLPSIYHSPVNIESENTLEHIDGEGLIQGSAESHGFPSSGVSSTNIFPQDTGVTGLYQEKVSTDEINSHDMLSVGGDSVNMDNGQSLNAANSPDFTRKSTESLDSYEVLSNWDDPTFMHLVSPKLPEVQQNRPSTSPVNTETSSPPSCLTEYPEINTPSSMSPEYPESPVELLNNTSHEESYLTSTIGKVVGKMVDFVKTSPSYLFGIGSDDSGKTDLSASPVLKQHSSEKVIPAPILSISESLNKEGHLDIISTPGQDQKLDIKPSSSTRDKREVFFDTYNAIIKVFQKTQTNTDTVLKSSQTSEKTDCENKMVESSDTCYNDTGNHSVPSSKTVSDEVACLQNENVCIEPAVCDTDSSGKLSNTTSGAPLGVASNTNKLNESSDSITVQERGESNSIQLNDMNLGVHKCKELLSNSSERETYTDSNVCQNEETISEKTLSSVGEVIDKISTLTENTVSKFNSETKAKDSGVNFEMSEKSADDIGKGLLTGNICTNREKVNKYVTNTKTTTKKMKRRSKEYTTLKSQSDTVINDSVRTENESEIIVENQKCVTDTDTTVTDIQNSVNIGTDTTVTDIQNSVNIGTDTTVTDIQNSVNIGAPSRKTSKKGRRSADPATIKHQLQAIAENTNDDVKEKSEASVDIHKDATLTDIKELSRKGSRKGRRSADHAKLQIRLQTIAEDLDSPNNIIQSENTDVSLTNENSKSEEKKENTTIDMVVVTDEIKGSSHAEMSENCEDNSKRQDDLGPKIVTTKKKRGRRSADTKTLAALKEEVNEDTPSNTDLSHEKSDATVAVDVTVSDEGSAYTKSGRRKSRRSVDNETLKAQIQSFRVQEYLLDDVLCDVDMNKNEDAVENKKESKPAPRNRSRKSTDVALLKSQGGQELAENDKNTKSGKNNSRKRKAEMELSDVEQIYRNKNFVKPEEHKPWLTILESPDRYGEMMGKKRLQRYINFDKPTQMKLRRRQQRATKNGWNTIAKKRKVLADEVVKDKLDLLWAELDQSKPESPSLREQLKQFVETD